MEKSEALTLIQSEHAHNRLRAARFFLENAEPGDAEIIGQALRNESVSWIVNALEGALRNLQLADGKGDLETEVTEKDDEFFDQAYSIAVENTTRLLLHEIEPILGELRLAVRDEIDEHESSKSWQILDRLESFLSAISTLSKSASPPRLKEFELPEMLDGIIKDESQGKEFNVETSGARPLIVVGDPSLIEIIFRNGLRNALEATGQIPPDRRKSVVVSWGLTDVDCWFSILDRGSGLPLGTHRMWEIGSSTKKGHLGMGLPIALQAARSHDGSLILNPGSEIGAYFEYRWPVYSSGES